VDLLATNFAAPLAAALAATYPDLVGRVIFDGCFDLADDDRVSFTAALCPAFPFDPGGGHIHRYWHMLRDAEASWPWHAVETSAHRSLSPLLEAEGLHDALLGLLKQPNHYGDIARAACDAAQERRYAPFAQPALLLDRPDDPAYRATAGLAAHLPNALIALRASTIEQSAEAAAAFLARSSTASCKAVVL
ncbi:MAG TPA: hypothetical protein VN110_03460, partial [Sphingobium sp.]|nr:hypothetical protein [Sphingobium sp.]